MQADLRLCWSHIPLCWKSHVAAHIISTVTSNNGAVDLVLKRENIHNIYYYNQVIKCLFALPLHVHFYNLIFKVRKSSVVKLKVEKNAIGRQKNKLFSYQEI